MKMKHMLSVFTLALVFTQLSYTNDLLDPITKQFTNKESFRANIVGAVEDAVCEKLAEDPLKAKIDSYIPEQSVTVPVLGWTYSLKDVVWALEKAARRAFLNNDSNKAFVEAVAQNALAEGAAQRAEEVVYKKLLKHDAGDTSSFKHTVAHRFVYSASGEYVGKLFAYVKSLRG